LAARPRPKKKKVNTHRHVWPLHWLKKERKIKFQSTEIHQIKIISTSSMALAFVFLIKNKGDVHRYYSPELFWLCPSFPSRGDSPAKETPQTEKQSKCVPLAPAVNVSAPLIECTSTEITGGPGERPSDLDSPQQLQHCWPAGQRHATQDSLPTALLVTHSSSCCDLRG